MRLGEVDDEGVLEGAPGLDWDALLGGRRTEAALSPFELDVDSEILPELPPRRTAPGRRAPAVRPADRRPAPSRPTGSRPRTTGAGYGSRNRPIKARAPRPAGNGGRRLHLTRRGRLVLLAVAVVVGLTAFGLGRASAGGPASPAGPATVTVQPGDTLWGIAHRAAPQSDPRDAVGRLKSLNHLSSADVEVGQVLRLR